MTGRRLFRGGMVLAAGNVAGTLASFIRNLIVARLVSVEDFGIASLFAMGMAFLQMISNVAVDRILIQSPTGDSEDMQSTAHAFQVVRGFMMALVLYAGANLLASSFGVPQVGWAFQVLAIVPAIRGFIHLDPVRVQREMSFVPFMWYELTPQLVTLLVAWPICVWVGDFRAMLWMLVVQAAVQVVASHWLARRRYTWSWNSHIIREMVAFGWPLMINGLLVFAILNGDKVVVGSLFSVRDLGWYGAAFMLALAPSLLVTKVLQSLILPLLSRLQDQAGAFRERYLLAQDACVLFGSVLAVGMVACGPALLLLLFGEKYSEGAWVLVWLGLTQGARTMKFGPMTAAVAIGKTKYPMFANVARAGSLALAVIAVKLGAGVAGVAIAGLIGEVVSLGLSIFLLTRGTGLGTADAVRPYWKGALVVIATCWIWVSLATSMSPPVQIVVGIVVAFVAAVLLLAVNPILAGSVTSTFKRNSVVPEAQTEA